MGSCHRSQTEVSILAHPVQQSSNNRIQHIRQSIQLLRIYLLYISVTCESIASVEILSFQICMPFVNAVTI